MVDSKAYPRVLLKRVHDRCIHVRNLDGDHIGNLYADSVGTWAFMPNPGVLVTHRQLDYLRGMARALTFMGRD